MTDTPTTPEACRAEQERVLAMLDGTTKGEWVSPWDLPYADAESVAMNQIQNTSGELVVGVVEHDCWPYFAVTEENARLIISAPTLARAHAALLGAYAEALEQIDLFCVDWATMPTETQDCRNWGRQAGGHFGPCGKCAACWLNQNMDALKELKEMSDKQRAEIIARDTIALVGTHGYAMNGPEEGELCEIRPTGEYRVLGSGEVRSIVDAPEGELYFLSEMPPAQAPASAEGASHE